MLEIKNANHVYLYGVRVFSKIFQVHIFFKKLF